jgi:hypothetical protein
MKKWYIVIIIFLLFYLVVLSDKIETLKTNKFLKRINNFINIMAWLLLIFYGAAFIYWIIKTIF